MIIKNCRIIYKDRIEEGCVSINEGRIEKINPEFHDDENILDAHGLYLSPGFIDVHIHGAGGFDTMDGTCEAINGISKAIAKHGTTSFLPTTMTVSIDEIQKSMKAVKKMKEEGCDGAQVLGVHIEGPFVSPKAIGAQNPAHLLEPSIESYKKMIEGCEDAVVCITLAPEGENAEELIKYVCSKGVVCSAGHTKADYETIMKSIEWGVSHSTHLYNVMTPFTHREPGVVGAIFDSNITTETIADGIHIAYPALRIAYKQKSSDKVFLVSDAMMACCMEDGIYSLGGQEVIVKEGSARLKNGALAGSVLTLDKAVKNVYENCNIPLYEIVKMATFNPAVHCKVDDHKGLIKEGYDADLLLFDEEIKIRSVFIKGKKYI